MLVKDYLKDMNKNQKVTFVVVKVVKVEGTPAYRNLFHQTPIRTVAEWLESSTLDYIVVKKDNQPLDMSGLWDGWYNRGELKCCMIISENVLRLQYSEQQAEQMIKNYKNKY